MSILRKIKRVITRQSILGTSDVLSMSYSERSSGLKTNHQFGPEIFRAQASGVSAIIADTAPVAIDPGTPLAIYNNTGTVQWVNMNRAEDGALTAPTGFANAFPLKPNEWTYINMGENDRIRTSSSSVGIYILRDDTRLTVFDVTEEY